MKIPMPAFIANAIISFAKRTPYEHLDGYMNRWWVKKPTGRIGKHVSARVHEILRSDDDRHLHDHPFDYLTFVMKGGYWEITHYDTMDQAVKYAHKNGRSVWAFNDAAKKWEVEVWCGPGTILYRKAQSAHRLVLPEGKTATTLFFMSPRKQGWGFITREGKISWREYLDPKEVTRMSEAMKKHFDKEQA